MLKVFQGVSKGVNTIDTWNQKYENISLGHWNFILEEVWIYDIDNEKTKKKLEEILAFFKLHQKKYNEETQ